MKKILTKIAIVSICVLFCLMCFMLLKKDNILKNKNEELYLNKLNESSATSTSNFTNVSEFGAVGDGETDDTKAFQDALDSGLNITADPNKTYLITYPLNITNSNQTVDLNDATIIFNHSQSKSSKVDVDKNAKGIFTINEGELLDRYEPTSILLSKGKLTFNSHDLKVDDFVLIKLTGEENTENTLYPKLEIIAKVIGVEDRDVYVDYVSPKDSFDFDTDNPSTKFLSYGCTKIGNVLENIKIKNINIIDKTPLKDGFVSESGKTYPEEYTAYCAGGLYAKFTSNLQVENFKVDNGMLTAVSLLANYDYKLNNIYASNSRLIAGGEGYVLQNMSGNRFEAKNISGYKVRHVVDVSGGAYGVLSNITAYDCYASSLSFHGNFEHDITVNNFYGVDDKGDLAYLGMGSGIETFGNAVANIIINNSNFKLACDSIYGNISFNNCTVELMAPPSNAVFNECKIFTRDTMYHLNTDRGQDTEVKMIIYNSEFTNVGKGKLANYDTLLFNNSIINSAVFTDVTNITVSNSKVNGTIEISNSTGSGSHIFNGNTFQCNSNDGISINDSGSFKRKLIVTANSFEGSGSAYKNNNANNTTLETYANIIGDNVDKGLIN